MGYEQYSFANAIILFGALQGFLLIGFLWKQKKGNLWGYAFFGLFLFSLAYVNLWYGLYFMGIYQIGKVPLAVFPYPYEYLIGFGYYGYVKSQIERRTHLFKKDFFVLIPALIYGGLQIYWYIIRIHEGNSRIYRELEASGFFSINEFVRFSFYFILGAWAIRYLYRKKQQNKLSPKEKKKLQWLLFFSKVFVGYNLLSILLTGMTFLPNPMTEITLHSFYLTFFTNTVFVYWIGFIGFTRQNILFTEQILTSNLKNEKQLLIEEKLRQIMTVEEQFKSVDFSLTRLASLVGVSSKEISAYINTRHKCNVSEYINRYRVEKVKALLDHQTFAHYTLEAIAQEAGFRSKSSFHSIFKKQTALTPSQYRGKRK